MYGAQWWWRTPLNPALKRQRKVDSLSSGLPGLQSEFQDSQGYTQKFCLENPEINKQANLIHVTNVVVFNVEMFPSVI